MVRNFELKNKLLIILILTNFTTLGSEDDEKLGIILFFKDYKEAEKNIWGNIGFLMLDQALGEYDVETKVGFIEFHSKKSKYYYNSFPLSELTKRFDNYFNK